MKIATTSAKRNTNNSNMDVPFGLNLHLRKPELENLLKYKKIPNAKQVAAKISEVIDNVNDEMNGGFGDIVEINGEKTFFGDMDKLNKKITGLENAQAEARFVSTPEGFEIRIGNDTYHQPGKPAMDSAFIRLTISKDELLHNDGKDLNPRIKEAVREFALQTATNQKYVGQKNYVFID